MSCPYYSIIYFRFRHSVNLLGEGFWTELEFFCFQVVLKIGLGEGEKKKKGGGVISLPWHCVFAYLMFLIRRIFA